MAIEDGPGKPAIRRVGSTLPARQIADSASIAAHYDKGDAIIRTFVDPETSMYSCALWQPGITSLTDAQVAKVDHSLAKLELQQGQILVDIGSGYGYTLRRAHSQYGVLGIGLNLSQAQVEYSNQVVSKNPNLAGLEYRYQGWEEFEDRADAMISIGAFEHFGRANYPTFFERMRSRLPEGGRMLLHSITFNQLPTDRAGKWEFARYARFIHREIFPNGELPFLNDVLSVSQQKGFMLLNAETLVNESGEPHYARTLDTWAANLEANRDEAVRVSDKAIYQTYLKYLKESSYWFKQKAIGVTQYLLQAV